MTIISNYLKTTATVTSGLLYSFFVAGKLPIGKGGSGQQEDDVDNADNPPPKSNPKNNANDSQNEVSN